MLTHYVVRNVRCSHTTTIHNFTGTILYAIFENSVKLDDQNGAVWLLLFLSTGLKNCITINVHSLLSL